MNTDKFLSNDTIYHNAYMIINATHIRHMYKLVAVSSRPNSRLSTTHKYTSHICHCNIFITCDAADNLYVGLPHRLPVGELLVRIVDILVG